MTEIIDPLEIESAEEAVEVLRGQFLRQRGWEYTSNTPGSHWLWVKKFDDGRICMLGASHAYEIEKSSFWYEQAVIEAKANELEILR